MTKLFYYVRTMFALISELKHTLATLSKLGLVHIFKIKTETTITFRNKAKFTLRNLMDLWVLTETYIKKDYQTYGIKIETDWTIIDIGAGIGDFSVLAAQKSLTNQVYAIEPFLESYNLMKKNINQNKIKNISISNLAISNSKYLTLNINRSNPLNNKTCQTDKNGRRLQSISLQKFMKINKINQCNLLKCDCEGAEFDIFKNLTSRTFKKIDNIVLEYHHFNPDHKLSRLVGLFRRNGYKVKTYPNPIHRNIGFLFASSDFKN